MLYFEHINHSYVKVDGDPLILRALQDEFTFESKDAAIIKAMARKRGSNKYKKWDSKIRLFNLRTKLLGAGLLDRALMWAADNNIEFKLDETLSNRINPALANDIIASIKQHIPKKQVERLRDYQLKGLVIAVRRKRALLLSPTGSGKSLIMYGIWKVLQKKTLIIVPTITLVRQLLGDFAEYENVSPDAMRAKIHLINSEEEPVDFDVVENGHCVIGTWQSIRKFPDEILQQFQCIIADEAHGADGDSIKTLITKCTQADYRIGTTATLHNSVCHYMTLESLFGSIFRLEKTVNLINRKMLTPIHINVIVLKFDEDEANEARRNIDQISDETKFTLFHPNRNDFIVKLALDSPLNTLTLFKEREHGAAIRDRMAQLSDRKIFYVDGRVDGDLRNEYRLQSSEQDELQYICSLKTWSTGINMPNLHRLVLGCSIKSNVPLLQSFGRTIRLYEGKEVAHVYDIVDDLTTMLHPEPNYSLRHFEERLKIYGEEQYPYSIKTVNLPKASSTPNKFTLLR